MTGPLRHSLSFKLFLLVLAGTAFVTGLSLSATWFAMGRGFTGYVAGIELQRLAPLAAALSEDYARTGDWSFLPRQGFRRWLGWRLHAAWSPDQEGSPDGESPDRPTGAIPPIPPPPPGFRPGRPAFPPPPPPLAPPRPDLFGFGERLAILDADGHLLTGAPRAAAPGSLRQPLRNAGATIGYLALLPADPRSNDLERRFLADQTRNAAAIGTAALLASALLSWLMARHLLGPIRALSLATRGLAGGGYDLRLDEARKDELGDLARSFNRMAEALAANERMRRQWVADTSHELRTPTAVLRAQIEALQDGVHQPDQTRLAVLHAQVMHLSGIVDDLYTLARSEVGELRLQSVPVDPLAILDEVQDQFAPRVREAGLSLTAPPLPAEGWTTLGDPAHLRKLFLNVLENAVRYTDPGGRIVLSWEAGATSLAIRIDDSPPGISEAELDRIFERFYRIESSRSREFGGSGLGLAICRGIAEAHQGRIAAHPSPLGGLGIIITLPRRDP